MDKKKLIFRFVISLLLTSYFLLIVPSQVVTVVNYFKLKSQVNTLDLEIEALAGSLLPSSEIDVVMKSSGYNIKLCSIMDSIDRSNVRSYNGEELESGTKILEYIIETKDDVTYLLSYLSGYSISYSSIILSDNELVLQIYCN